jgi:methionyl-tRNA formyltransferase
MLKQIAMLAAETARTRAYLLALAAQHLLPSHLVLLTQPGNAGKFDIGSLARSFEMDVAEVEADDINDPAVVKAVAALSQAYVIFSGPAGAIVRKPLFGTGKKFIHVHPGRLPEFRGSTTIYYSLLAENKVEATALLLDEVIDAGPVIGRAAFEPPADRRMIDGDYDPDIRASLLTKVVREFSARGCFDEAEQPAGAGETFYIIHPVLKHLAILAS